MRSISFRKLPARHQLVAVIVAAGLAACGSSSDDGVQQLSLIHI